MPALAATHQSDNQPSGGLSRFPRLGSHRCVSSARWRSAARVPASAAAASARRSSSACSVSRSASRAPTTPRSSASSASRRCTSHGHRVLQDNGDEQVQHTRAAHTGSTAVRCLALLGLQCTQWLGARQSQPSPAQPSLAPALLTCGKPPDSPVPPQPDVPAVSRHPPGAALLLAA